MSALIPSNVSPPPAGGGSLSRRTARSLERIEGRLLTDLANDRAEFIRRQCRVQAEASLLGQAEDAIGDLGSRAVQAYGSVVLACKHLPGLDPLDAAELDILRAGTLAALHSTIVSGGRELQAEALGRRQCP